MDIASKVRSLFPAQDRIPPDVRLETPLRQDAYLVNGELRRWTGPMQDVLSPVCIETAAGLSPYLLGSYPLLSENEALTALHAAEQAYGQGRGRWPTMSVGDRIKHMEDFAYRCKQRERTSSSCSCGRSASLSPTRKKNSIGRLTISEIRLKR